MWSLSQLFGGKKSGALRLQFGLAGEALEVRTDSDSDSADAWLWATSESFSEADQRRLQVLHQWLADGQAEIEGAKVLIPLDRFYSADPGDRTALNLAPPARTKVSLKALGSMHESDMQLTWDYRTPDGRALAGVKRIGCFLDIVGERSLLSAEQYKLLRALEAFAARPEEERNYEAQLAAFAHLKAFANACDSGLDQYLTKEEAVIPQQLTVAVVEAGPDTIEIQPVVAGIAPDQLGSAVDGYRNVPTVLTLQEPDGGRTRVVLDPPIQEGLRQIKRVRRLKGKDRKDFLARPQEFLDANIIDLEEFGDRVKGIGIYPIRYYPLITRSTGSWLPEKIGMTIASDDPDQEAAQVEFETLEEFVPLEQAHEQARQAGSPTIPWGKWELPIDGDTSRTLGAIRSALEIRDQAIKEAEAQPEAEAEPEAETPEPPQDDRSFLLIHDNIEEAAFSAESPTESNVKALAIPKALLGHISLLRHQVEGIAWLQNAYRRQLRGALLADDMGLGKTLQILAFMAWYRESTPDPKPILVIAPVALLENWRDEYLKFLEPVFGQALELHGDGMKPFRTASGGREYDHGGRKLLDQDAIQRHPLVLTTYEAVRDYQFSLAGIPWGIVVTDEAQKIKTPSALVTNAAKALQADFRIAATGTPVENSLVDLWCLMDFVQPGLLGSLKGFRQEFDQPKAKADLAETGKARDLRQHIEPAFLRRAKVDILKELPDRIEHEPVFAMSDHQAEHYLRVVSAYKAGRVGRGHVLQVLRQLRDISVHPGLAEADDTPIDPRRLAAESPKLAGVIALLQDMWTKGEKCILFTEDRRLQRQLASIVQHHFGFAPAIVNGEVPGRSTTTMTRKRLIDQFQDKTGFSTIVLSPLAVGFGLTITAANHVIHVTRLWNPAKEDQATDRAHRIGQTKDVQIYYPQSVDPFNRFATFDQIIAQLLAKKRSLAQDFLYPTESLGVEAAELEAMLLSGIQ